jgi:hypothetical protein
MKKWLLWNIDMAIYRLFYWRWSPRLRRDPDLAYIFSKIGESWTNGHPPENPDKLDSLIVDVFAKPWQARSLVAIARRTLRTRPA